MANVRSNAIIKFKDNHFLNSMKASLLKFGKVKVTGLGVFQLKKMKAKKNAFNVGSGERQTFPSYYKIIFTPTKKLKREMQ